MTKNDNIIKNFIYQLLTLTNYLNIKKSFVSRYLQDSSENSLQKEENQKKQITELLIYLTILFSIIIVILVGYSLYKKYLEKKALREILRENANYENIQNSISAHLKTNEIYIVSIIKFMIKIINISEVN